MTVNFCASATTAYMHPDFSTKHSKPGKKTDIDKIYTNFFPLMTQQQEDLLNNKPTYGTGGFRNAMFDNLVYEKFNNLSIKWDPSISFHLKSNQSMIKTVLATSIH